MGVTLLHKLLFLWPGGGGGLPLFAFVLGFFPGPPDLRKQTQIAKTEYPFLKTRHISYISYYYTYNTS